jgi:Putative sensor
MNVTAEGTFSPDSDIDRIFGAVVRPQTYRHLLFLLISFPLGILYFVTMVAGMVAGIGTAIIVIGFVILAITLLLARLFGRLERELSKALLGATFESPAPFPRGLRAAIKDRRAWSTLIYLLVRFPLGVAGFIASVLFIASIPMMAAPLLYTIFPITLDNGVVATSEEALLVSLFGFVFFLIFAHVVNGLAALSRRLGEALL